MRSYQPKFTAAALSSAINTYFLFIQGEYHIEETPAKGKAAAKPGAKIWDRQPEPATITGLALHLGFCSRQQFDEYEQTGKHAALLKRGRMRIEAEYEKKLHQQPASGAIFALKSMGWNEKPEDKTPYDASLKTMEVKITQTGPLPAANEKDVLL